VEQEVTSATQQPRAALTPSGLWPLLKATYSNWTNDKAPRMGAALAYYTVFSLAPLSIIAIYVAGVLFGAEAAQGAIVAQVQGLVGTESAQAIQTMIHSADRPATGLWSSILGVLALLFGASGVFAELQDALNTIWRVPKAKGSGIWNFIRRRFVSFAMVLGIGFLLLVSLLLSAALSAAAGIWRGYLPLPPAVLQALEFAVSLVVITTLFAMIFKLLPETSISWSDVWTGAALTSLLFTIGKFLIGLYVGRSVSASAYGAAGSLVILILWTYYSAQILYFGAEFTRQYAGRMGSRRGEPEQAERGRVRQFVPARK
jgi:membrane protein